MKTKVKAKKSGSGSSLSKRALLVNLKISNWTGRRTDETATATVEKTHKASHDAGSYTKRLLPGAKELQEVHAQAMKIRKYTYEQTLPWMTDGARIVSAKNYLEFSREVSRMISDFDSLVKDFEGAYPRLQQAAQAALGSLYDPQEYPSHAEIRGKFAAQVTFLPLPDVKDFRTEVTETEKRAFLEKMRETEQAAMRDVWERVHAVTKAAAEKLGKPDAIFRDSLMENVSELCALLPALNVSDDSKLEAARRDLEKLVSSHSADSLRANPDVRADVAKKFQEATDKMSAFFPAAKK